MIPAQFEYPMPKTIPEAIVLLSGGHSLIPLVRFRIATQPFLVDMKLPAGRDIGVVTIDEIATCILAELVQVHGQRIASQAVELAQAVAVEESIVSAEVIDPI